MLQLGSGSVGISRAPWKAGLRNPNSFIKTAQWFCSSEQELLLYLCVQCSVGSLPWLEPGGSCSKWGLRSPTELSAQKAHQWCFRLGQCAGVNCCTWKQCEARDIWDGSGIWEPSLLLCELGLWVQLQWTFCCCSWTQLQDAFAVNVFCCLCWLAIQEVCSVPGEQTYSIFVNIVSLSGSYSAKLQAETG